jgi:zona occludens toxin
MPINAYTGLMGSGKSYECVSSVIIPAIKNGRRVVTNVDGIDSDAIRAYCQEKWSIAPDKLGHVVHCKNEDVHQPHFLPHGTDIETFCKPGDIICIDEAWRFWGTDCKLSTPHKIFFREHRHFVDAVSKVCCDLVLMVQDISDLHRTLKVVVEVSFRTTKIKTLGFTKTYRVEMWEGYKLTQRARVAVENKRYDNEVFPLYSSYVGGSGKELQVDGRQNVLNSPKLWILAGLVIVMFAVSLYYVIGFFNGSKYKKDAAKPASPGTSTTANAPTSTANASASPQPLSTNTPSTLPGVSDVWRIVGTVQSGAQSFVIVANTSGHVRLEHPSAFQQSGMAMVGEVDGQRVMVWSGGAAASYLPEGKK